jgi:hypothetical protein
MSQTVKVQQIKRRHKKKLRTTNNKRSKECSNNQYYEKNKSQKNSNKRTPFNPNSNNKNPNSRVLQSLPNSRVSATKTSSCNLSQNKTPNAISNSSKRQSIQKTTISFNHPKSRQTPPKPGKNKKASTNPHGSRFTTKKYCNK